eukprot:CAMPEP_0197246040 /NCGR_PEP_ID=MMETSP1429-20130617/10625_1 /TAXON_ID=49237 /ORGANISM="Chaetoceros  sp., Strain UNC1202" /LENGTH=188 /DNA_ID=CAMNT_0042706633 /DNA_START=29 /DNA_END=595 /DNA_ORIENTATION=+
MAPLKQFARHAACALTLLLSTLTISSTSAQDTDDTNTIERPFLVRDLRVFGTRLPISPMTILIFGISALILFKNLTKPSTATASHILLDNDSDATRDKMIKMKEEIGDDHEKFAEFARKFSTCPSGKNGNPNGSLGKFTLGTMVPPFDKAVFSSKTKAGSVIGPVQTQFGYHLILVHEKDEQRSLVVE